MGMSEWIVMTGLINPDIASQLGVPTVPSPSPGTPAFAIQIGPVRIRCCGRDLLVFVVTLGRLDNGENVYRVLQMRGRRLRGTQVLPVDRASHIKCSRCGNDYAFRPQTLFDAYRWAALTGVDSMEASDVARHAKEVPPG